ncbi:MAG: hypothetical protein ACM3PX_10505 [Omnitrophica WOR_2 bacterium]
MTKFETLVNLVRSLSISEKKAFKSKYVKKKAKAEYMLLYDTIEQGTDQTPDAIRNSYLKVCNAVAIETTIKYLFELLLDTLLELRKNQDSFYSLFNKILKARVLYEKSLFDECFEVLSAVKKQAKRYENYYAMLLAGRLELEYLLALNFPQLDEKELLQKQFELNESLKFLRKVNEQASLYEILKHRIAYKGYARSIKQKDALNDLVFSELSLVASFSPENFEIAKLHQLFQSSYLISVGDYKSALRSYYELNNLLESNKHLWSTPPVYYAHTLEGVLESLRSIRNYEGMGYFISQLQKIESNSVEFNINLTCLIFLYELFPLIDCGEFKAANEHMLNYKSTLYDKFNLLNMARQAEVCLYTSMIFFGNGEYHKAHKFLSQILIKGKNYFYLPLYRTIRLFNLMILYKLGDFELIGYEIRSIRRDLSNNPLGYKIERFFLRFLQKEIPVLSKKKEILWKKINTEFDVIKQDVFEQQVLHIFDFTAWVQSILTNKSLSEVLSQKSDVVATKY